MSSKVPSYIDIFTENGVRVTTIRPIESEDTTIHIPANDKQKHVKYTKPLISGTRLFKENPYRGPYTLISNSSEGESTSIPTQNPKLMTKLQTRLPHSIETASSVLPTKQTNPHTNAIENPTPSSPLQITFFVASEDETKQPSASTLVSDPFRQDDATTYQYTILRSVKQSIDIMKHENDTAVEELGTSTEPISITRRIFRNREKQTESDNEESPDIKLETAGSTQDLSQSVVNGHTNHRNLKTKNITDNYSQILRNLSMNTEATTTRRPWRPSTRRPWRQRSSYKQFYSQRKGLNQTTSPPFDPTSIVEIRKTYSVTASRKRKPPVGQSKSYLKSQKLHKRKGDYIEYQNADGVSHPNLDTGTHQQQRVSNQRRFLQTRSDHSSLL